MKKHQELIEKIQTSNLTTDEKNQLIDILNKEGSNYDDFLKVLLSIFKLGQEILNFLDFSP